MTTTDTVTGWKLDELAADPFANVEPSDADRIAAQYEADRQAMRRRTIALAVHAVTHPDIEKD